MEGARVGPTWLLIGGAVAILSCFFVMSLVLLALVLVRNHRRRRGTLAFDSDDDLDESLDEALDADAEDVAASDEPRPPVA
jgi:hypothetical protein